MKTYVINILFFVATLLLTSCEHKDLCYDHIEHAPKSHVMVDVTSWEQIWQYDHEGNTDWCNHPYWGDVFGMDYKDLSPAIPKGLRIYIYKEDGTKELDNLTPDGGITYITPGTHSLLFYNNDTEYIVFDNMQTYATARATTRSRSRSTYLGNKYMESNNEEQTVNPPDMLYGNYIESYTAQRTVKPDTIEIKMQPLVFTYLVRYEFTSGLEYVAMSRGALAGMAKAVYLNSGQTSEEDATVLFDCTTKDFGTQAIVRSFGVPDFPNDNYLTRTQRKYALNLEVRLKNGNLKTFDFDVTDQVKAQPQGGVIIVSGVVITDEEGKAGSSGFDVEVDDWGDYKDIDLPL